MTTDFSGKSCAEQPKESEFPVLVSGVFRDCAYKLLDSANANSSDASNHGQNVSNMTADSYAKEKLETVHLNVVGIDGTDSVSSSASGVIIGTTRNKILIATANHGADPTIELPTLELTGRSITMPDGSVHAAKVELSELKTDTSVLSIDRTSVNSKSYNTASFAEKLPDDGDGFVFGIPLNSNSIYVSPAIFEGVRKAGELFKKTELLPGADPEVNLLLLRAHTEKGESGGPIFASTGEVVGILEGGPTSGRPVGKLSYAIPLTKSHVDQWLKQIRDKD